MTRASGRRTAPDDATRAWADSGLAAISGPLPGGRLGPPTRLVPGVLDLGRRIGEAVAHLGGTLDLDWLALLGERAALAGLRAGGRTSCGGGARLLRCADGWIAPSLARPSDVELVPAWLHLAGSHGVSVPPAADHDDGGIDEEAWERLGGAVSTCGGADLIDSAELLGLPVGRLDERRADPDGGVVVRDVGGAEREPPGRVLDLTGLWAGPLCASLLAATGAEVVKVEDRTRPDGARAGDPVLYDLLNGMKHPVTLDLRSSAGRDALRDLVRSAAVVVTSARTRALHQLGLDPITELAAGDGPDVWISITGHGSDSHRVAFGDDAAVAGGLVVTDHDGPWFCGDAIADPLGGLAATAAAVEALAARRRVHVDVAMSGVAAAHAGATLAVGGTVPIGPGATWPRARTPVPSAPQGTT